MPAPELSISLGQYSEAGRQPLNQDFHGAALPDGPLLHSKGIAIALADGIASSAVSQQASAAAVRGFLDDYYCTSEAWPVRRAAQRVLQATNAWLHAQTQLGEGRFDKDRGHVCTFSALVLKGREAHLLHVGDSRIYRLHPQALEQLTEDHRVRTSATDSHLGRALGIVPHVEIDYQSWPTEPGEVYLLATDGAWEHLDAAAVHAALAAHPEDLQAVAEQLVATALDRGSDDNLTVQLLRIDSLPAPEASQLQQQRAGLALPPALQPGMAFEGYRLVRELHASSRSHVHLATDDASGQAVVIKTPSVDQAGDADYLDRFMLEEWVARRIGSHPHVLQAAPAERARHHLFSAMEFVDGQTLAQWMTDHPRPDLATVRGIVEQIARGLQAFHRKAMLHQDLRPDNVMIDRAGTVKLIDFGAAHVDGLAEGTADEGARAIRGALQYTAPEYFSGQGGSAASDLFSLAVITYQMLSSQLPYGMQVTQQVRSPADLNRLRYIPLRSHRPDLPAWLDAVLRKALHPQAARRQEVLSEFIQDLRRPGAQFQAGLHTPLVERDPVVFWRSLSVLLALAVLVLLGLRVMGR